MSEREYEVYRTFWQKVNQNPADFLPIRWRLRTAQRPWRPVWPAFGGRRPLNCGGKLGVGALYVGDTFSGLTRAVAQALGAQMAAVQQTATADGCDYFDGRSHFLWAGAARRKDSERALLVAGYARQKPKRMVELRFTQDELRFIVEDEGGAQAGCSTSGWHGSSESAEPRSAGRDIPALKGPFPSTWPWAMSQTCSVAQKRADGLL